MQTNIDLSIFYFVVYMFLLWESLYSKTEVIIKDYDVYSHLTFFCNEIIFCIYIYAELLLSVKLNNYFLPSQDILEIKMFLLVECFLKKIRMCLF